MNRNIMPRMLKTAVIKEELVALTGHWRKALVLNQFIYWSQHRSEKQDMLLFLEEERMRNECDLQSFEHGWIYKKAAELIDELMLDVTPVTIRQDIQALVDAGLLDQRPNPKDRLDRTLQYRPNIMNIQYALQAMGYALDRYPLLLDEEGSFVPRFENSGSDVRNKIIKSRKKLSNFAELNNLVCSINTETTPETTNIDTLTAVPNSVQSSLPVQPTQSVQLSSQQSRDETVQTKDTQLPLSTSESIQTEQTESVVQADQTPHVNQDSLNSAAREKKPRRAAATNRPGRAVLAAAASNDTDPMQGMTELAAPPTTSKPAKATKSSQRKYNDAQLAYAHAVYKAFEEELGAELLDGGPLKSRYYKEIYESCLPYMGIMSIADVHHLYRWMKNTDYWAKATIFPRSLALQFEQWQIKGKPMHGVKRWTDPTVKPIQPAEPRRFFDPVENMYSKADPMAADLKF